MRTTAAREAGLRWPPHAGWWAQGAAAARFSRGRLASAAFPVLCQVVRTSRAASANGSASGQGRLSRAGPASEPLASAANDSQHVRSNATSPNAADGTADEPRRRQHDSGSAASAAPAAAAAAAAASKSASRQRTAAISACRSPQELHDTILRLTSSPAAGQQPPQLDMLNTCAALSRLAKLDAQERRQQPDGSAAAAACAAAVRSLLPMLLSCLLRVGQDLDGRGTANCLWALAKLHDAGHVQLPQPPSQAVAAVAQAASNDAEREAAAAALELLLRRGLQHIECHAEAAAAVAPGLQAQQADRGGAPQAVLLEPQHLANMAWAAAKLSAGLTDGEPNDDDYSIGSSSAAGGSSSGGGASPRRQQVKRSEAAAAAVACRRLVDAAVRCALPLVLAGRDGGGGGGGGGPGLQPVEVCNLVWAAAKAGTARSPHQARLFKRVSDLVLSWQHEEQVSEEQERTVTPGSSPPLPLPLPLRAAVQRGSAASSSTRLAKQPLADEHTLYVLSWAFGRQASRRAPADGAAASTRQQAPGAATSSSSVSPDGFFSAPGQWQPEVAALLASRAAAAMSDFPLAALPTLLWSFAAWGPGAYHQPLFDAAARRLTIETTQKKKQTRPPAAAADNASAADAGSRRASAQRPAIGGSGGQRQRWQAAAAGDAAAQALDASGLSILLYSCAVVRHYDPDLTGAALRQAVVVLDRGSAAREAAAGAGVSAAVGVEGQDDFTPQGLANLVWATAQLNHRLRRDCDALCGAVSRRLVAEAAADRRLSAFRGQHLAAVAWGLTALGAFDGCSSDRLGLLQLLLDAAGARPLASWRPQELRCLLLAGHLGPHQACPAALTTPLQRHSELFHAARDAYQSDKEALAAGGSGSSGGPQSGDDDGGGGGAVQGVGGGGGRSRSGGSLSRLARDVQVALHELPLDVAPRRPTPDDYFVVDLYVSRWRGRPCSVAVEVDGPARCAANDPMHPTGDTALRDRLLASRMPLAVVRHGQWVRLETDAARRRHLAQLIGTALAAQATANPAATAATASLSSQVHGRRAQSRLKSASSSVSKGRAVAVPSSGPNAAAAADRMAPTSSSSSSSSDPQQQQRSAAAASTPGSSSRLYAEPPRPFSRPSSGDSAAVAGDPSDSATVGTPQPVPTAAAAVAISS